MADIEKVIKGLEQFKADFKPFCGNGADWKRVDDALAMLKEHEEQVQSWTKQISDKQFAHALDIRDSDEERTFNQGVKSGLQIALDIIKRGS